MEDLSQHPSTPPKPYNQKRSLAIAVAVSAVFLVAAAGICIWLLTRPASSGTVQQQVTGDGSESVKTVEWAAPDGLTNTFARREQHTQTTNTTYYYDVAAGCGITTNVQPVVAGKTPKDTVLEAAQAAKSYGITTTGSTDADTYVIKDADKNHSYDFKSLQLEQTVDVSGIAYKAQRTVVAYKQFNTLVASISYSCKTDAWDTKKAELQTAIQSFIVKTTK